MSTAPTGTLTAKIIYDVDSAIAQSVRLGEVTEKQGQRVVRQVAEINSIFKTLTSSQSVAADVAGKAVNQQAMLAKSAKETAWAMRTVPAQMTDVFTQLAGGANPMMVLIQQGGQLKDVFGGFGPMFRGLASFITAPMVAMTGLTATIGLLGFEFYQADQRSKEFQKNLLLTGNYAGMTQSRLTEMAAAVAAATRNTTGTATETISAVVGSGQFGPQNVQAVAEATARLQRITGDSAQTIVKDFASMTDGVAKWAAEHNKSGSVMNFVTTAQYEQIKALEEAGRTTEAVTVLMGALNGRISDQGSRVSGLAGFWIDATDAFQKYVAAQTSYWRTANVDSELQRMRENEKQLQADLKTTEDRLGSGLIGKFFKGRTEATLADTQNAIKALEQSKGIADQITAKTAESAKVHQDGIQARQWVDKIVEGAKATSRLNSELEKAQLNFKKLAAAGTPVSDAEQKLVLDAIRKKETPRAARTPKDDPGETYIKNLQRQVEQMERGRFEMMRLEAAQKKVADAAEPYIDKLEEADKRAKMIAQSVRAANSQIDIDTKQQAAIDSLVSGTNDMVAGIIREAESYGLNEDALKSLNDERQIELALQKSLVGANGDTAASLYAIAEQQKAAVAAARAIQKAKEDAYKADPNNGITKALKDYVKASQDMAAAAENTVVGSLKRAGDAFINFVKTGKLSLGDLFGFMAEEYLRQMFKMQAAQLVSSGGFSLAGIFSKAISWGAGLFSGHANGLAYVPYDNYPAMLHEGEKVLTKQEAAAGNGSGNVYHQNFNIGQGVTPQQVQMAMDVARRSAVAQAKGEVLQSIRRQGAFAQ